MSDMLAPHLRTLLVGRDELVERAKKLAKMDSFRAELQGYRIEILRMSAEGVKEKILMSLIDAIKELDHQVEQVAKENVALHNQVQSQGDLVAAVLELHQSIHIYLERQRLAAEKVHLPEHRDHGMRYSEEDGLRWKAKRLSGKSVGEIADEERVRPKTVRNRLRKLGVIAPSGATIVIQESAS